MNVIEPPQKVPATLLEKPTRFDIDTVLECAPALIMKVAAVLVLCAAKLTVIEAIPLIMVKLPVRLASLICWLVTPVMV